MAKKKMTKKILKKTATPKKTAKKPVPLARKVAVKAKKPSAKLTRHVAPQKSKPISYSNLISPLEDRVLVKMELGGERRSAGGLILLAETASVDGHSRAQVVAVGPGKRNKKGQIRPLDLQIGDWVLLSEYAGDEVELNSVKLKIVREGEILGVVGNG